jgi:Protein of unknown function DUF262
VSCDHHRALRALLPTKGRQSCTRTPPPESRSTAPSAAGSRRSTISRCASTEIFPRRNSPRFANTPRSVKQESHKRLNDAYDLLHERLSKLIIGRSADDWQLPLIDWYKFVLERARVIDVHVANENRAFIIFETLNDRGLNLSTSDLLKNHLFGTAGSRIEECKLAWGKTMAPFSGGRDGGDADTFLRHYWASSQGIARVKALFSQMRDSVGDEQDAVDLATQLAECAPLWSSMFDRDADYWKRFSEESKAALETLSQLKVEQCRPLLLAAMRKLPESEVSRILGLVVSWSIRWFVAVAALA